jgi:Spy/CpxP family protein refolding chaperone
MKTNKLNLMAVIALGGLVAFGPLAKAEDANPKPAASGKGKTGERQDRMKSAVEELNLTDDQKAKVKPILQDEAQKLKALRQDTSLAKEDKKAKLKSIREDTNAKIKPILTADQLEKWNKTREAGPKRPRKP